MLDGAAPVGFGAVVAGAGFVAGPLMLGGARCLDASRGWCLVSEESSLRFMWTGCNVQVAFCIYFGALI